MAMNIPTPSGDGGDYLDDIRYDAKAARWARVDYNHDTGNRDKFDMVEPFQIAIDFANGEYGWIQTRNGFDLKLAQIGQPFPPKPPGEDHKRGFRFKVYRSDLGLRHFLQTSGVMIEVFDQLHTHWEREAPSHSGQVPVVQVDRAVAETVQARNKGTQTVYRPQMRIVQWVPRPTAMSGNGVAPPASAAAAPPPAASMFGQPTVAAPVTPAQPAQETVPPPANPVNAKPATAENEFV